MADYSFKIGSELLGVRTTSHAFATWLEETFSDYIVDEESDPHFSILIEENGSGAKVKKFHILYRSSTAVVKSLHVPTIARSLMAELEWFLLKERDDAAYVAFTPLAVNGSYALFPALWVPQLGGLGRTLDRAGLRLAVDTAVGVDENGQVVPCGRFLQVPSDSLERLAKMLPDSNGGRPERFAIEEPFKVDMVFTRLQRGGGMTFQPVSRARALYALTVDVVNIDKVGGGGMQNLARFLEGTRCYGLASSAPKEMLDSMTSVLGR